MNGQRNPASGEALFRIVDITQVQHGAKKAAVVVAIPGVGQFELDYVAPNGMEAFLAPAAVQSAYDKAWRKTFKLERALLASIFEAVLQELGLAITQQPAERAWSQPVPPLQAARPVAVPKPRARSNKCVPALPLQDWDAFLDRQEDAFNAAVERFDGDGAA